MGICQGISRSQHSRDLSPNHAIHTTSIPLNATTISRTGSDLDALILSPLPSASHNNRRRSSASVRGLDVALGLLDEVLQKESGSLAAVRLRQVVEIVTQSKQELLNGARDREVKSGEDREVASWLNTGFLSVTATAKQPRSKTDEPEDPKKAAARKKWHALIEGVIQQKRAEKSQSMRERSMTENSMQFSNSPSTGDILLREGGDEIVGKEEVRAMARTVKDLTQVCLSKVSSWNDFDVFLLNELSEGSPLTTLVWYLLDQNGLFDKFALSRTTFLNCFSAIEAGYNDVPYHNCVHAADVVANTYYFILSKPLSSLLTRLDLLASIVAASIHDFKHPGTNNLFSVSMGDEFALTYNDRAVLENMHLAEAFRLFKKKNMDLFSSLPKEERKELRQTIVSMVLATDMSQHLKYSSDLENSIKAKKETGQWFKSEVYEDRLVCLNMALHVADLGNPAKPLRIYLEWTERVVEEFFRQGDLEKERGLTISPMMNREKPNVEKSQIGFIDYVINPLYRLWGMLMPDENQCCMENIKFNRQHWESQISGQGPQLLSHTSSHHHEEKHHS